MTEERNFRIDITKSEYKLIQEYRLKQFQDQQAAELRKTCNHQWAFWCSGHKDDHYICSICGESEDR